MRRHALTDEQWVRLKPLVPKPKRGPSSTRGDRLFIDAVLYRAKTGVPWRDLPERFGPWKSVYNRFSNWARKGHWQTIFRELQYELEEVFQRSSTPSSTPKVAPSMSRSRRAKGTR